MDEPHAMKFCRIDSWWVEKHLQLELHKNPSCISNYAQNSSDCEDNLAFSKFSILSLKNRKIEQIDIFLLTIKSNLTDIKYKI